MERTPPLFKREECKYIKTIPAGSGCIVAMCEYKGEILVACQYRIYFLTKDRKLKPIKMQEVKEGT